MKMKIGKLRQKCSDEKYYEAIKYMAHILTGRDRSNFIRQVCKYNIYLGTICATTCEFDYDLEKYIRSILNNYFKERKINYYDKETGQNYEYVKKIGKKDVDLFMFASYELGNFKALKWAIYNFDVSINTLIRIGQKVSEKEFIDVLTTISKSNNAEKMKIMCRTRSLSTQEENAQAKKLLRYYWNRDMQIFTYLADSFGVLSDLENNERYGEMVYAKCFEGVDNSIDFNNIIINALSSNYQEGLERLFRIISNYGSDDTKKNLYMLVYMKLQNHLPVYKSDFRALSTVPALDKRELYLGRKTIGRLLDTNCSGWINVFDFVYYFPRWEEMYTLGGKVDASRNIYPLNRYMEAYPKTTVKRILYTYFNTHYKRKIFLDDLVMSISEYCNMEIADACKTLNDYDDFGRVIQRGQKSYFQHDWLTLEFPLTEEKVELRKEYRIIFKDYDYINHVFYVSVSPDSR